MITVTKQENGVLFTFTNSDKYLYGSGTIEVPFNSLSIIQDESDNITLRKSASNDIFLSAKYDTDFGYASKEEAVNALKEILYDEAGISEEEVQQMIDAATSGIPSSEVIEQLRTDVNAVSGEVQTKADASALTAVNNVLTAHTANTTVHVTQAEKNTWNGKVDEGYVTNYAYSKNQIDGFLENATTLLQTISGEVDTKVDTTTYESGQYATAQALNALQENKLDASAYTPTDLSQYWTSGQTQEAINAATSGIPSSQVIEQLRTDVNAVSGEVQTNASNIADIWDTIDLKEEVIASALTQLNQDVADIDAKEEVIASALTEVRQDVAEKQDALSAGTGIEISGNVISATGGSSVTVDSTLDSGSTNPVANSAITAAMNAKADTSAVTAVNNVLTAHTANTTVHVTSVEKDAWNAKANIDHVTQSEYNAMVTAGTLDSNTMYIIDDAVPFDPSTKADTSAVTAIANDVTVLSGAIDDAKAYYISFATIATTGIRDEDWDGIVAAIDDHRPIYAGYPRQDGGIIYYGVECMNKNSGNTEIVMTASDNSAHYFYTFTKNGSNDYSYTVSTKPYVPDITTAITSGSTDTQIPTAKATYDAIQAGGGGGVTVDDALSTTSENPVANSAITNVLSAYYYASKNNNSVYNNPFGKKSSNGCVGFSLTFSNIANPNDSSTGGLWVSKINNKDIIGTDYSAPNSNTFNLSLVETSAITTSMTSSSTDAQVPSAKAVYDTLGGLKFVKLTQSEYDNLATKDANTLYIISD